MAPALRGRLPPSQPYAELWPSRSMSHSRSCVATRPSLTWRQRSTVAAYTYFFKLRTCATSALICSALRPFCEKECEAFLLGPPLAMKSVSSASDFF